MGTLFLKIVNMSIAASWLILAVVILRLVLKKAPKWINCALWAMVAERLICPISFESAWSLIPRAEVLPTEVISGPSFDVHTGFSAVDTQVNDDLGNRYFEGVTVAANHGVNLTTVIGILWLIGVLAFAIFAFVSYRKIYNKVRPSLHLRENIWICDDIQTPFILGIFKPRIYIPSGTDEKNLSPMIAHENAHLKRRDHWWKPLGYLVLAIHWFNPLVWLAYILLCRDIELACDEKVVRNLSKAESIAYSEALLSCSVNRRTILVCPLAFGEVGVKERVKRVLNYKKPAFWVIIASIAVCAVLAACFLTNPAESHTIPMKGQNIADLEPQKIVDEIHKMEEIDADISLYTNEASLPLLRLNNAFEWWDFEHMPFFYTEKQKTYYVQFKAYGDTYSLTERREWPEQNTAYHFQHYLEALKYLPQEYIKQAAPGADKYVVEFLDNGTPEDYDHVVTYTRNGVGAIDDWYIHLKIQPLYMQTEDTYEGRGGAETIHVFYGVGQETSWTNLDGAASEAILNHFTPSESDGLIHVESHETLLTSTPSDSEGREITLYLLVLHESFRPDSDISQPLESVGGDYIPTVLTFRLSDTGEYILDEYWEPRDGGDYTEDIKAKFPEEALTKVQNEQDYVDALEAENQQKAFELLATQGDFDEDFDGLLTTICSSPAQSSNPGDYIREHQDEYDTLVKYGEPTLRNCFRLFLDGGQTDLRGHIMAALCRDIMTSMGEPVFEADSTILTGQDWFDAFSVNAKSLAKQYSPEELEKHYPASWSLLQME